MAKKENGRELLRQDNNSLRKQFIDCRNLLEKERKENAMLREEYQCSSNKGEMIMMEDDEFKEMRFLAWNKNNDTVSEAQKWIEKNVPDCDFEKEHLQIKVVLSKHKK